METRCPRWYQINIAALTLGELRRATGGGLGFWFCLPFHVLSKLAGRRWLADDLVPEEITLVEQPEGELAVPEPLAALGFASLLTVSLPEFSGSNLIQMLRDESGETVCEFMVAWSDGAAAWGGANIVLASGLENGQLLRTIASPQAYPTLPPPGHHVVLAPGLTPQALYARHRDELAALAAAEGSPPIVFDGVRSIDVALRSHRELVAYQVKRGVFVQAEPASVEALLRGKQLTRATGA